MTRARFPIARMDALMGGLTAVVLALPVVFAALAIGAVPLALPMLATAGGLVALYVAVWLLARPTRYDVDADGLHVVFPAWTRTIPRVELRGVEAYAGGRFRSEVGWGLRIGVGGLWGTFGLLVTPLGTLETYVSRTSDLVLVTCEGRRDLLLSPADLDGFCQAVEGALGLG